MPTPETLCATPGCQRERWAFLAYCSECILEHHPEFLQEAAKIPVLGPPVHMSELDAEDTEPYDPNDLIEAIHEDDEKPN